MPDVPAALLAALDGVDILDLVAALVGPSGVGSEEALQDPATGQFLHAFEALLREGLAGGSDQREFVMETAIPAMVASGQSALQLVHGHVAIFTALSPLLVAGVPEEQRREAGVWLASYAAGYVSEVAQRALLAEAGVAEPPA